MRPPQAVRRRGAAWDARTRLQDRGRPGERTADHPVVVRMSRSPADASDVATTELREALTTSGSGRAACGKEGLSRLYGETWSARSNRPPIPRFRDVVEQSVRQLGQGKAQQLFVEPRVSPRRNGP